MFIWAANKVFLSLHFYLNFLLANATQASVNQSHPHSNISQEGGETCSVLFSNLNASVREVFFVLFILGAVLSAIWNTVASVVLVQPQMRCRSNKILTSLVVCDALIGYTFLPFMAYSTYNETHLRNCSLDLARDIVTVSLLGTSGINIGLVAFDCYVLLTNLSSYNHYMSHKRINFAIALSWIFPPVCACTRFVHIYVRAVALGVLDVWVIGSRWTWGNVKKQGNCEAPYRLLHCLERTDICPTFHQHISCSPTYPYIVVLSSSYHDIYISASV